MFNQKLLFVFILIAFLAVPVKLFAAELLQVQSSRLLKIGDHNRSYSVQLACLDINPEKEEDARNWLKSELKRGSRVNLRPQGSNDGVLVARVISIDSDQDLSLSMAKVGLATFSCEG